MPNIMGTENKYTPGKTINNIVVIDIDMTATVQVDNIIIRNRPSVSGSIINRLYKGDEIKVTKKMSSWLYVPDKDGWINSSYITLVDNKKEETKAKTKKLTKEEQKELAEKKKKEKEELEKKRKQEEQLQKEYDRQINVLNRYINETTLQDKEIVDSLIVNNLNGIYGIPYQFMESVDPRLSDSVMGRKYSEKIISKMPLLCMTPGKVKFMSNFSKEERDGILAKLVTEDRDTDISNIITKNGRYFTFDFSYAEYFQYVNGLCRAGAKFLNIQNVEIDIGGSKAKLKEFDWANALNKNLKATLTSQEFIGFYMDSTDSVSENFSNDTTQSQLSSTVNGVSDMARELGFLMGAGAGAQLQVMDEAKLGQTMDTIKSISDKYLNGNKLLTDIANNFATIAVGGKLLFPEIWSDSSFSRSFDITIKLRTPDADVMSWYLNIYVPLCHLIAFAAGHQTDNPNGYYSPFLVRAFYKGLFNVDMGIITDMSITKGKEGAWNIDGLPTEIDVNLTIKDLYNMLSIVSADEPKNFVTNNILMDYIANTCGININQMDIMRSLEIYYILKKDKFIDLPNRVTRKFQDAIDSYAMNLYNSFLNNFLL